VERQLPAVVLKVLGAVVVHVNDVHRVSEVGGLQAGAKCIFSAKVSSVESARVGPVILFSSGTDT
jgi:hypothetical protein